ncbi:MAG: hypothetical protein ACPGTG_01730, partial [Flavobacteriales bacterium]
YSTNMLEMLLESKGKDVIKKNTLEYTANMAVVYGLTKFYVKASKGSKNEKLNAFYKIFNRHKDNPNDTIEVKVKFDINENNTYYYQCPKTSNTKLYANMVLMDMVYQILRNNENAKKLGFFQMPQPFGEAYAEEQNTYNLLHKKLKKMKRDDDSKHLKGFYDYLEKQLKFLIDNFYTIGEMHKRVKTLDGLKQTNQSNRIDTIKNTLINIKTNLPKSLNALKAKTNEGSELGISQKDTELIAEIMQRMKKLNINKSDTVSYQDDLLYINNIVKPLVVNLTVNHGFDAVILRNVEQLADSLFQNEVESLKRELIKKDKKKNNKGKTAFKALLELDISKAQDGVLLLKSLSQLDQASSYERFFQILSSMGNIVDDNKLGSYIKILTDFSTKYAIVDKKENSIAIDVEEVLYNLSKQMGSKDKNSLGLYFSVGLSQTLGKVSLDNTNDKSFGYVSEKIGLKINIRNFKRARSIAFEENNTKGMLRSKTPLVSDVYGLVYGSGILYNITNTSTSNNLEGSMFGASLGIAFFNDFDVNLGISTLSGAGKRFGNNHILNFSLDLKFFEYIDNLRKKRETKRKEETKALQASK